MTRLPVLPTIVVLCLLLCVLVPWAVAQAMKVADRYEPPFPEHDDDVAEGAAHVLQMADARRRPPSWPRPLPDGPGGDRAA